MTVPETEPTPAGVDPVALGRQLRAAREGQSIGLRELSRRLDVSASFLSQVEHGRATPSVGTLYAIVSQLGVSLDQLFHGSDDTGGTRYHGAGPRLQGPVAAPSGPVVREHERETIHLASQVTWGRLTATEDTEVDFLHAVYRVGGASCDPDSLVRHSGHEYGLVLEGRLGITIGFESWVLGPGDSVSFPSTAPHRLWAEGSEDAKVVWFVRGRRGEDRSMP